MITGSAPGDRLFDAEHPLCIADQGCFYVAGEYDASDTMTGQMFVQYQVPARPTHAEPVVLIHGGGQTGAGFLSTPDRRRGWSDHFVARGFTVYVVDVPGCGRSQGHDEGRGPRRTARSVAARVGDTSADPRWSQSSRHTQWPGAGVPGDPTYDAFYASQVAGAADPAAVELDVRRAGADLLDQIGPSIIVTHSLGAPLGWQIADARPDLTSALVVVEPTGPAVHDVVLGIGGHRDGPAVRPWGLTRAPLTYDPPVHDAGSLTFDRHTVTGRPELAPYWLQSEPAARLGRLAQVRMALVTGEASYHAPTDHGISAYLTQAGVAHDVIRLADHGIRGNGHMMMLEQNNLEVAALLEEWIRTGRVGPASTTPGTAW